MRVRIQADGTKHGTRITNAATGEDLRCSHVKFEQFAGEEPKIELELVDFEVEAEATSEEKTHD